MAFCIFDPALMNNAGHHSSYCRNLVNELRSRNMEFRLFSHQQVTRDLIDELAAVPCFETCTYHSYFQHIDPVAGWLTDFDVNSASMLRDLEPLGKFKQDDILFFNSVRPAQFNAIVQWLQSNKSSNLPRVFAEFGTEPGVDIERSDTGELIVRSRDPRWDPRSVLYRYAASRLTSEVSTRLTLFTFERSVSEIYAKLTHQNITTLPWPHPSNPSFRRREAKRKLTVAFVGHQRYEKGFHLVPNIIRCLSQYANIEFLVHNSVPYEMYDVQKELYDLSNGEVQIQFNEKQADGPIWQEILDLADIIVCPYDPIRYSTSHSALLVDCIANGIPAVVPAKTVLASMAREYNQTAIEFEQWAPHSVADAIIKSVAQIDELGLRAHQASQDWDLKNGVAKLVDCLLS